MGSWYLLSCLGAMRLDETMQFSSRKQTVINDFVGILQSSLGFFKHCDGYPRVRGFDVGGADVQKLYTEDSSTDAVVRTRNTEQLRSFMCPDCKEEAGSRRKEAPTGAQLRQSRRQGLSWS